MALLWSQLQQEPFLWELVDFVQWVISCQLRLCAGGVVNQVSLDTERRVILCFSVLTVLYVDYTCYTFMPHRPLHALESVIYLVLDFIESSLL